MCIICVKPSGVPMPSSKTLQECWQGNSDGAGIAYSRSGVEGVKLVKGFMKLKTLKSALNELAFTLEDQVIIHFRFATHGLKDAGNCHPFPVSKRIDELRALEGSFNTVVAHNGVFGSMPRHETLSDTQKFIGSVLASSAIIDHLEDDAIQELIAGYCGSSSRLVFLRGQKLFLLGQWVKDEPSGLWFSNDGYKPYMPAVTQHGVGHGWQGHGQHHDGDDYDYEIKPEECLLCEKKESVKWRWREDAFLCEACYEFSLTNNNGVTCGK